MTPEEISALEERIKANPKSRSFLQLAEAYIEHGEKDKAQELLTKGVEFYPYYLAARITLGQVQMEKGKIPEAIANFEFVSRTIPDNLIAQKSLALLYLRNQELEKAKEAVKIALSLSPDDPEVLTIEETISQAEQSAVTQGLASDESTDSPPEPEENPLAEDKPLSIPQPLEIREEATIDEENPSVEEVSPTASTEITNDNDTDMLDLLPKTETMGDLFMEQKRYPQAEHIYMEVLQANPQNIKVKQKLALAKAHLPLSTLVEAAEPEHLIEEDVAGEEKEPVLEDFSTPEPILLEEPLLSSPPPPPQHLPVSAPPDLPKKESPFRPPAPEQAFYSGEFEDPESLVDRIRLRLHRDVLDVIWASPDGLAITGTDSTGSDEHNEIFAGEGVEFLRQIGELGASLGKGHVQDGFIWMEEAILYFHDFASKGALFIWLRQNANVGRCRYIISQELENHSGKNG